MRIEGLQLSLPLASTSDSIPHAGTSKTGSPVADPVLAFVKVFRRLGLRRPQPEFQVEYRPYSNLRSTVRLRDNRVWVRISDLLAESPPIVLEALAEILLGKLFHRQASREARECYLAYVFKESTRRRIEETRRRRGHKMQRPARGRCFDLEEIFADLNRRYFEGGLPSTRLGWSRTRARTILGHYDSAHASITISPLLDSPKIPRYLVEYLMFHEMLHIRYPVERRGHRRIVHSRQFREAEKSFPSYEQARRRLKLMSGRME
jgi:SprT-like family protein